MALLQSIWGLLRRAGLRGLNDQRESAAVGHGISLLVPHLVMPVKNISQGVRLFCARVCVVAMHCVDGRTEARKKELHPSLPSLIHSQVRFDDLPDGGV